MLFRSFSIFDQCNLSIVNQNQSIQLVVPPSVNDVFTVITFGSNIILGHGISYMQFKDMLNRTHFKRLNADKQTFLTADVLATATTISVVNASLFDLPSPSSNKPGVIEINGERIEFFTISGNVLGQLRRGTLGTGVPAKHLKGTIVQEIGASETIPIGDQTVTEQYESDGTNILELSFSPNKSSTRWKTLIPSAQSYGQNDEIEVFVGGYFNTTEWLANTNYSIDDIVKVDSYT